MTFSERERFIYHSATLMTLEVMGGRSPRRGRKAQLEGFLELIKDNRCRKLTSNDVDVIYKDIEEEVLLSSAVYDLHMERGQKKGLGKFFGI